jgi:hypothetical protein
MMTLDNLSLLLFGAFISGMIGLFFSMINQYIKEWTEIERIAKGFYIEIKDLNNTISPIVEDYVSSDWSVGSPYLIKSLFKKDQLIEGQPLYTDKGWYFAFQKDLVLFSPELIESTVLFYRKIVYASALLEEYLEMELATQNQSRAYTVQDNFFESLEITHDLAPYLLTEFGKYNKKQQVKQWFRFNFLSIIEA